MRRQGGGFGFVVLLVVLAVILMIAAKNWKAVAPTALEIHEKNKRTKTGVASDIVEPEAYDPASSTSSSSDTWNPSPPARPSLSGMEERTSAHGAAVGEALKQTE